MRLAVVVLNWNGAAMTLDCVESLRRSAGPTPPVIVVDNGSSDDSVAVLRASAPDVELIVNPANVGFAAGSNVGIRWAVERGAEHVLVLNNDTIVAPQAVPALMAEAARLDDAGALSPLIRFAEPPDLIWFAGADFDPRRGRPGRMTGYRERDVGQFRATRAVDRLTGAAMLVTRDAIMRTGMFDADLFFLYEDVDWSLRMRAAGLRQYVVPAATVWHRVAATQRGEHSLQSIYYGTRNQLVVCDRHAPLGGVRGLRRTATAAGVNLARVRRADHRGRAVAAFARGLADGLAARLGPWDRTP